MAAGHLRLVLLQCSLCVRYVCKLLQLAGDVEQNPGPLTSEQEQQMFNAVMAIPMVLQKQTEILGELRSVAKHDMENRSRRNNLIFFGFQDAATETWQDSETKVLDFCKEKLNVSISADSVERAHRLGRYTSTKKRPIIVKFLSFKDKQRILLVASRLKGTNFAISEDYSNKVRQERQKLIHFAKNKGGDFRLQYNKLRIGKETFIYNAETDNVDKINT
ncbi:uncharacterized protein LOC125942697 [Dermacentor silvarum]|uniref:uncharacterized protein LOC125942697 n=1 Tax=Dermacentor silvarum TaxID=543639 RepID=UPI002100780D|nr:uncharacterized protein LOC125942697 [Dermacentor silvarum]